MHTQPRVEPIDKIVIHINVGPETPNTSAEGLANYLRSIQAGYHAVHDNDSTVVMAADDVVVWGASGMNARGLHSCIIGMADQTRAQWLDSFSRAAMQQSANWAAPRAKKYGIPVLRLSPQQVAVNGVKGFCGHVDVNMSGLPGTTWPGGHYDPGPNFPWDVYLQMVDEAMGNVPQPPTPEPAPIEESDVFYKPDIAGAKNYRPVTVQVINGALFAFNTKGKNPFQQGKMVPFGGAHIIDLGLSKGEKCQGLTDKDPTGRTRTSGLDCGTLLPNGELARHTLVWS